MAGFGLLKRNLKLLAIIVALMFLFWPATYASCSSKHKVVITQIKLFEEAISHFRQDTGRFPSKSEGLSALSTQPADTPQWKGPYLPKDVPPDAWGHEYVYLYPPVYGNKEFDLYSVGENGVDEFGKGDDITNWGVVYVGIGLWKLVLLAALFVVPFVSSAIAFLRMKRTGRRSAFYPLLFAAVSLLILGVLICSLTIVALTISAIAIIGICQMGALIVSYGLSLIGLAASGYAFKKEGFRLDVLLACILNFVPWMLLGLFILLANHNVG